MEIRALSYTAELDTMKYTQHRQQTQNIRKRKEYIPRKTMTEINEMFSILTVPLTGVVNNIQRLTIQTIMKTCNRKIRIFSTGS